MIWLMMFLSDLNAEVIMDYYTLIYPKSLGCKLGFFIFDGPEWPIDSYSIRKRIDTDSVILHIGKAQPRQLTRRPRLR